LLGNFTDAFWSMNRTMLLAMNQNIIVSPVLLWICSRIL
jgi:hypothetical protein